MNGNDSYQGRFESILSNLTDAIVIVDTHGAVRWVNSAAEQMFGRSLNQIAGTPMPELFPADSCIEAEVRRAMARGQTLTDHDLGLRIGRNPEIPITLTIHPLMDDERNGAAVVIRDITGLKSLERAVRENERVTDIAALAAGIAHEIKNPLGGIRGAAQLLGLDLSGAASEYTDLIIREADRINRLITDLINLSHPAPVTGEPVNVYPALDDVIRLLEAPIAEKKLALTREFDPSLPHVTADKDRLRQIFLNLMKNAVEACGDHGGIQLRAGLAWRAPGGTPFEKDRKFALVEFIDNGAGMDESVRKRLFTPFTSGKKGGAGLGLSVTFHLVKAHGGYLEIDNRADGPGVRASVYLPYFV